MTAPATSTDPRTGVEVRWADPTVLAGRLDLLDDTDLAELEAHSLPARRAGFVAGRVLTKLLLAEVTGRAADAVRIRRHCGLCGSADHGKPYPAEPDALPLSLSHAPGIVLVAVGGPGPLGVDVTEVAATAFEGFERVALTPEERTGNWRHHERARYWSRKEAALKATGVGLSIDPRDVGATRPDRPPAVRHWPLGIPVEDLHLVDLDLPADFRACVAVQHPGPRPQVRCRAWSGSPDSTPPGSSLIRSDTAENSDIGQAMMNSDQITDNRHE